MLNSRIFCLTALAGMLISAVSAGPEGQGSPIYIANQNPFVQIFGLPKAEPGWITPKGRLDAAFLYFVSNNAIQDDASNGESIIWDGETAQYDFRFRYGLADWLELGVDIPFIEHSGGWLDSVIRSYHKAMGFPNDRQEQFEKDQINFQLDENGNVLYSMTEEESGLGDVRLTAAVPLLSKSIRSERYLALRSVLKLPTGDADYLLGSGGTDVSLGLSYSDFALLSGINMVFSSYLGAVYLGEAELLGEKQQDVAGYGGASLAWLVLNWLELKLQLDLHSAFYDTELKQLGSSVQLLGGGTVHLPGEVQLDFGISEQIVTDATPDVGFYLFVRRLF
jgi:hypothetical protein